MLEKHLFLWFVAKTKKEPCNHFTKGKLNILDERFRKTCSMNETQVSH